MIIFSSILDVNELKAVKIRRPRLFNAHIDWDKTNRFYELACDPFILSEEPKDSQLIEKCNEIQLSVLEKASEVSALYDWGFDAGILEENDAERVADSVFMKGNGGINLKSNVSELAKTGLYVYLITLGMMTPFLVSCVVEASYTFRKKSDNDATKMGVILMIIGFCFIIVGLIWINYLFMGTDLTLIPTREMAI
ncbi:MAG: hypothetical protein ACT4OD_01480 [Candidatus Nitrosotenuis sp.]